LLFSDIVGSTPLAQRLGDHQWKRTLSDHDRVIAEAVHRLRGRIVDTTGDGVFARFDGSARAVEAAVAMREAALRLGLEIRIVETADDPLVAVHPEIAPELAIQGFDGVRAYTGDADASRAFLADTLGFEADGETEFEVRGDRRGSFYAYDEIAGTGWPGAGTVHHVAWSSPPEEHEAWRKRVEEGGGRPTGIIDRYYFKSIYFREPSGVLFEIATIGPGFATDEDIEHLGERLALPPAYEHLREQVEKVVTPLPDPRADWAVR